MGTVIKGMGGNSIFETTVLALPIKSQSLKTLSQTLSLTASPLGGGGRLKKFVCVTRVVRGPHLQDVIS